MKRAGTWTNADGLRVGFGTRGVETTYSSKAKTFGPDQVVVMRIKGADLADSDVAAQLDYAPALPAGAFIKSAYLQVDTAFEGTNAVLDIGLYKLSDNTAYDDDGIDAAVAVATLAADGEVACDGDKVGKELTEAVRLGASYDTAAFTAGAATLVVTFVNPLP